MGDMCYLHNLKVWNKIFAKFEENMEHASTILAKELQLKNNENYEKCKS